ncbi:MAG TPA: SDR family NAD(P)-dependent oxidoreductase, partial [Afifellaceae bacterium]|nr:SDR family NAD(P)-dependent oxidoreductase [Afifellaceae bacterium]
MLNGKSAIVTGSTSGIGLGIAKALAGAGVNVALNSYTDAAEDHALAEEIAAEHGVEAVYIQADMSKPDDCVALVENAVGQLGPVQILVNNAGIQHVAPIEDFPSEKWDAVIAINLSSSFHTIRAAVPGMKDAGWGRIVNIASVHGLTASPFKSAYVAAKHGMLGLTKTVALELAELGTTCNAICPGYV